MNNRIAVFASGGGTNLQALIDEINRGNLNAVIAGLITSRPDAGAAHRAGKNKIPVRVLRKSDYSTDDELGDIMLSILKIWDPCLIVLAGFMQKIPVNVIKAYSGRIINIHPALLPKFGGKGFYGIKVHEAVIDAGETQSGCTVHLVTEKYDEGPIIEQSVIPLMPGETPQSLASRVLNEEHKLLPAVTQAMIDKLNRNEYN